jgi:hypothetical protein
MYEKITCPNCHKTYYRNVQFHSQEIRTGSVLRTVETTETISEDELLKDILQSLNGCISDGIAIFELCKILNTAFGVSSQNICEIVERIKLELDMYCPDRKHLYFIQT